MSAVTENTARDALYVNACLDNTRYQRELKIMQLMFPDTITQDMITADKIQSLASFRTYDDIPFIIEEAEAISTPWIRDIITDIVVKKAQTAKGSPLPKLTFKTESGQKLTSEDFKGEILYLDFWGVGCGPCMGEFSIMDKFDGLYKEYADKLQIITICCKTPNESTWRNIVEKYNLKSLNTILIPEESDSLYSKLAWPTYMLVDKDGNIFNSNAQRPSTYVMLREHGVHTDLEQLLQN